MPARVQFVVLRSFGYESDLAMDTNGFLYWLKTQQHTQPWHNTSTTTCYFVSGALFCFGC